MKFKQHVFRVVGILLIAVICLLPTASQTQAASSVFINEIHYDNDGTDADEAIEIAGPAGTDLSGWSLVLYNGNGGAPYNTTNLTGVIPDQQNGYGTLIFNYPVNGIQNGSPDGVALVNGSTVVQFLSYEGTFTAVGGPADGMVSVDIGVSEAYNAPLGTSLQLTGTGSIDDDFTWSPSATSTYGAVNTGQTFSGGTLDYTPIYDIQYTTDPSGDSPLAGQIVTTEGVVTAVFYNSYFIQDGTGPWNGVYVYDSNIPMVGDRVRLTGSVTEYYNLTEIHGVTEFQALSTGNALPAPEVLSTVDVNQEQWEGVLVRVENVTVTNDNLGYGEWSISDGSGDVVVDDKGSYTYAPTNGDLLDAVIGPLDYSFGVFKIQPRDNNDIVLSTAYTPIYDIQFTTDPGGNSPLVGQADITTEGVVTAVFQYGYFIQDGSGAWNGLWVHDTANSPAPGDRVRLTGTVREYYNLTELDYLTDFQLLSSGNALPDPVVLATSAVSAEPNESVLVRVENVTVTNPDLGYGEWSVSDGSGDVVIDDKGNYTYVPTAGELLAAVIGPLDYSYGVFKILPRDDNDIVFPAAIVINELLADPAGDLSGDANGDGTRDSSQDEFVELVNNSNAAVDISGWTLADGYAVRHTFPAGTVVPANCGIVVFGGGAPTGFFGGVLVQTASTGSLGLNNSGDSVMLNDSTADVVAYAYGSEGGYDQSLTRDPDITGPEPLVQHSTATGSGGALFSPGTMVDGSGFSGCVSMYKIHEVQGSGTTSPIVGSTVVIEGIVVGDFQNNGLPDDGDLRGFYVQEEDADADGDALTSEGVLVYDGYSPAVDVQVGDLVQVRGLVTEYNDLTEITNVSVSVLSSGNVLPTPGTATLPVASVTDLEAFEGMRVTFPQALVISEYFNFDRYGEIVLTSERHLTPSAEFEPGPDAIQADNEYVLDRITLDDGRTSQNPDPAIHPNGSVFDLNNLFRGGDTVQNVTGVIDYAFGLYRIQPTQGADYFNANPRAAQPEDVGGNLKVASFNVLNYFTTLDNSGPICGPLANQDCRGADDAIEFERQRAKIIAALSAINADVVGLIEIENHPGDVPTADLVSGLNDVLGAGTYDYVTTGAIGTDAIRVAFIYKPAKVSLVGNFAILDSTVDARFLDDYNRPALAQTFQDTMTGGIFTVSVNHLKSKGSTCDAIGDPDLGDGAGNCNLTRKAAAEALVDWLANDPTNSGDSDFLIIGDLNSYDKEDPIDAILAGSDDVLGTGDDYSDLLYNFIGEDAYSYVFDGRIGYLDHGLAHADFLSEITGVTVWHINADEPDLIDYDTSFKQDAQDAIYAPDAYRSSDHDPVIVGLDVCDDVAPTIDVSLTKDVLWPANHKYVTVHAKVTVADNYDTDPTITLVSVTSSEPDDGLGDGDTPEDIVIMNDFTFKLRAERSGAGEGRVYTITYQVTDACGNSAVATATVTVPHNQ